MPQDISDIKKKKKREREEVLTRRCENIEEM